MNVIPVIIYAAELAVAAIILFYVVEMLTMPANKRSRFSGQNGGLAKVDSGFGYAANFSSFACVA